MNTKEFLIKMSNAVGVSGYEAERAEIIIEYLKSFCDEISTDKIGNVIGIKKGKGKGKLMLSAHMDEIGLMVSHIDEQGFLGVTQIGGFDQRTLLAHEVVIHGKKDKVYGIIGIKPPHITTPEEAKKSIKLEHLLIDTGYDVEEVKELISIGDLITINRQVVELKNNRIAGKCMDDTAGIATYATILERLKGFDHDLDIYFVASAQEEVGVRGAQVAAQHIEPDLAIVLEVGFGKSSEGSDDGKCLVGEGVEIVTGVNIHRKMFKTLKEVAKKNGIKHQVTVYAGMTPTDCRAIQVTGKGAATSLLQIPTRYMHTSVETLSMDDVEATGRLIAEFIINFNNCDLEEFLCL
ncbi:MAG: M20/M25/M40 family metallo-hydrolase [Defluviitaleaceae bacterium]|nr:M20/M25/M40 family metallo-hydrolase [Defluviitaleaceae bacterium]